MYRKSLKVKPSVIISYIFRYFDNDFKLFRTHESLSVNEMYKAFGWSNNDTDSLIELKNQQSTMVKRKFASKVAYLHTFWKIKTARWNIHVHFPCCGNSLIMSSSQHLLAHRTFSACSILTGFKYWLRNTFSTGSGIIRQEMPFRPLKTLV